MNSEQFTAFLRVFQENQQQLIEEISVKFQTQVQAIVDSTINTRLGTMSTNIAHVAPFENFKAEQEKFSSYLERFENYYTVKALIEEKQIAQHLCDSIGSDHHNGIALFLGPDKPLKSLNYTTLVEEFKKLLIPKKSVVVSQHYFLNIFQKDGQSISEFVADLRRDLTDCEFSVLCRSEECKQMVPIADVFLRAQFIRGLRDDWLREQILQSDSTKFDDILQKAVALEASKIESKEFQQHANPNKLNFNANDINKISNSFKGSNPRSHKHLFDRSPTSKTDLISLP